MESNQNRSVSDREYLGESAAFREEQYLQTVSSGKRHELLFEPYGVSLSEFRTLLYLSERPEGIEPSKIADDLLLLRQNMTHIVDELERRGLVERVPHPRDRRRICVRLLEKGRETANALSAIECDYTRRIHEHFTREEYELYRKLVQKMAIAKEQELDKILQERREAQT